LRSDGLRFSLDRKLNGQGNAVRRREGKVFQEKPFARLFKCDVPAPVQQAGGEHAVSDFTQAQFGPGAVPDVEINP
jgi:hypothetical protein